MTRALILAAAAVLTASPATSQHALVPGGPYDAAVPTPQSILGYAVGERFTPHHLLMRYLDALAAASPRVQLDTVAHSFEGREVMLVTVTSEANHQRIEPDPRGCAARRGPARCRPVGSRRSQRAAAGHRLARLYRARAGGVGRRSGDRDAVPARGGAGPADAHDPRQHGRADRSGAEPDGHERHAQDVMRMRSAWGVPTHPRP
jgi:hypothetical protein